MTLGLMKHLPSYRHTADCTKLLPGMANQVFNLAARNWQRDLGEFNAHMIDLELRQLTRLQQIEVLRHATNFLTNCQYLPDKQERMRIMQMSDKVPADILHRLQDSLASLEQALLDKDPLMPNHLRNTHAVLISYPETVHLLSDAEIASIIDAAEIHTKTEIVKAVASGKSAGGTRKKVDVSDL